MIRSRWCLWLVCVVAGCLGAFPGSGVSQEPPKEKPPSEEPAPAAPREKPADDAPQLKKAPQSKKPEPPKAGPATALVGATVLTMAGDPIENATVLFRDGKILAVGGDVTIPDGTTRIALDGHVICPGFIDATTVLGLPASEIGAAQSGVAVRDGLDPYDRAIGRALAEGVTAVYVTPRISRASTGAIGSVVKVRPRAAIDDMIVEEVAAAQLTVGVSSGTKSDTVTRWASAEKVRKALTGAKKYGEAKKKAGESLEKWRKDLAEWRKTNGVPVPKDEKPAAAEPDPKKAKTSKRASKKSDAKSAKKKSSSKKSASKKKKKKKPKKRPRKPKAPRVDAAKEALLRVLAREIPLRIEAHRKSDIERALQLAEEFDVRLVLDGCTEGASLAKRIAKAEASVVVGPLLLFAPTRLEYESFDPSGLAAFHRAGVRVAVSTADGRARVVRMLRVAAAYAAGCGLGRDGALRAITIDAARALGVENRLGSLEKGKDADFVVLDGHPLDRDARVKHVFVDGEALIGGGN